MMGLSCKHDSGTVRRWGNLDPYWATQWEVLGGPVIGFHFVGGIGNDISFVVGDGCRPKYFGARKLSV